MTFHRMLVSSVVLLIAASSLSASQAKPADVTGIWTGTFTIPDGQREAYFDLKQKGTELSGTAGPGLDRQVPIANGKITTVKDVTTLTFEATEPSGSVIKFDLKLLDGRLKGKATGDANGEKREALIDVGRAK